MALVARSEEPRAHVTLVTSSEEPRAHMALVTRSEEPRAHMALVTRLEPKIRLGTPVSKSRLSLKKYILKIIPYQDVGTVGAGCGVCLLSLLLAF